MVWDKDLGDSRMTRLGLGWDEKHKKFIDLKTGKLLSDLDKERDA